MHGVAYIKLRAAWVELKKQVNDRYNGLDEHQRRSLLSKVERRQSQILSRLGSGESIFRIFNEMREDLEINRARLSVGAACQPRYSVGYMFSNEKKGRQDVAERNWPTPI